MVAPAPSAFTRLREAARRLHAVLAAEAQAEQERIARALEAEEETPPTQQR